MAFANRLGSILKNAVNSTPSIYQSVRCMSSSKLFVGGISYSTDDYSLKEAFESYGEVVEAKIITDRDSGRSRGFGFVTYTSADHASAAINAMDGKELHGRVVRVNYANDRGSGFRTGGGGFGGGGGAYGGSGGGGYYSSRGGGYGSGSSNNYDGGGVYGGSGGGGNYSSRGGGYGSGSSNNYDGGGAYGGSGGGGNYSSRGGGYGSGSSNNYDVGDANFGVTGGSGDSFGGGYAGNDSGVPNFRGGSTSTYGSNTLGGGGYGKEKDEMKDDNFEPDGKEEDDLLDEMKDDDFEPDDYANKRS